MIEFRKPKIGLLGMMIEGYEPLFPGIIARQEAYARSLAESLSLKFICRYGSSCYLGPGKLTYN